MSSIVVSIGGCFDRIMGRCISGEYDGKIGGGNFDSGSSLVLVLFGMKMMETLAIFDIAVTFSRLNENDGDMDSLKFRINSLC